MRGSIAGLHGGEGSVILGGADRESGIRALRCLRTCDDAVLAVAGCAIGAYGVLGGALALDHGFVGGGRAVPADPASAGILAVAFAVTTATVLCSIAVRILIRSWIDRATLELASQGRGQPPASSAIEVSP